MTIYVGNLNYKAGEKDIQELFSAFGDVSSVSLISDKFTGRSKGFAFVEMDDEAGKNAIENLHETEFMDRNLVVNEARPREPKQGGGYRGGGQRRDDGYNNRY
jgi:cold-inducible RNA-binding protein